jgi:hypothetical protein
MSDEKRMDTSDEVGNARDYVDRFLQELGLPLTLFIKEHIKVIPRFPGGARVRTSRRK